MNSYKPENIDAYIAQFPEPVQVALQQVRETVKENAPGAEETISYGMPAFRQQGIVVYFAGFKNHIGLYPLPSGVEAFKKDISAYKHAKGSIQFPLDKPMPLDLIGKIVRYRVQMDMERTKTEK